MKNLPFKVQIVLTDTNSMPKSSSYDLFILVKQNTILSKSVLKKSIIEIKILLIKDQNLLLSVNPLLPSLIQNIKWNITNGNISVTISKF